MTNPNQITPRYLQRDPKTGEVIAHFANPQPYAQERVPPDHPDLIAWSEKIKRDRMDYEAKKAELRPEALLVRIKRLEKELFGE